MEKSFYRLKHLEQFLNACQKINPKAITTYVSTIEKKTWFIAPTLTKWTSLNQQLSVKTFGMRSFTAAEFQYDACFLQETRSVAYIA